MHHASAGETQELRVQVGQCLSQILAQTMPFISILGHQRNHINVHNALIEHKNLQHGLLRLFCRSQHASIFLPRLVAHLKGSFGQQLRVFAPSLRLSQYHAHLLLASLHIPEESREVIFGSGLHRESVETIVLESESLPSLVVIILLHALDVQTHVGGIVRMYGVVHTRLQVAQRVSEASQAPSRARSPSVAFHRTILERAVLHQFGIESAIGSTTDILEEDTDQFITNSLPACRRFHGFLG